MQSEERAGEGQPHDRIKPDHHVTIPAGTPVRRPQDDDVSIGTKMLSAVSGSVLTSLLVTPLDVVRVRLQSQQQQPAPTEYKIPSHLANTRAFSNLPPNLGVTACCREVFWVNNQAEFCVADSGVAVMEGTGGIDCAVEQTQRKTYNSTLDGLRKIARNEGFLTLWRGLSPTLVMAVPGNVIYFAGYDWLRTNRLSPMKDRVSELYAPLVAGSTARVVAALFVSPIELFRTRMQASHSGGSSGNFKATTRSVQDMVRAEGYHTLWRGLNLTLWRDVPFSAFYWWGYEMSRNFITDIREKWSEDSSSTEGDSIVSRRTDSRERQNHTTTLIDSFAAGAISGAVASVVTTPFDVGKTRQQTYEQSATSTRTSSGSIRPEERSMPRFLWHIFKEEGFSGLFKGWTPRVLKVAPACAIMISSYEIGKKMAKGVKTDDE